MTKRAIFYDTETTGLSPENDRIIEIAAFDPENNKTFNQLVNPKIPIPQSSTDICNITNEMVQESPTFEVVGQKFSDFCSGDCVLVAHNNDSFDIHFLRNEFQRENIPMPKWQFVDTLKWARIYRSDLPKHNLQYLRQIYNIDENNAHRALDDVIVLYKVYKKMVDDLSIETVYDLLNTKKSTALEYMPFGKYQGKKLSEVPGSYVKWLEKSDFFLKPQNKELKQAFEKLNLLKVNT